MTSEQIRENMKLLGAHKEYLEIYDKIVELSKKKRLTTDVAERRAIGREIGSLRSQISNVYRRALDVTKKEIQ